MKLLFIANARIPTERAMGTAIMKQCEAFAHIGYEVTLAVPRRKNEVTEDPFLYHQVARNFHVVYLPSLDIPLLDTVRLRYFAQKFSFFVSLMLYVWRSDAGILYTREPELIGPLLTKKKKIVEIHHFFGLRHFGRRYFAACSGIITITRALKEDLGTEWSIAPDTIKVAPSGVDLSLFQHPVTKDSARSRLGITSTIPVAMYIGSLEEWKGYRVFLESAKFLQEKVQCVVIGGSDAQVEVLRREYPKVLFLGTRPQHELSDNQQAADVLVIPNSGKAIISARHTSPLKALTHMISGVPIVASDIVSLREILSEENAVMISPDDPEALARGITEAIENSEHSVKIAAQAKIDVTKYDWKERTKIIDAYIHEFTSSTHR